MKPIICYQEEHCIMCGEPIPEGRQVCPNCIAKINNTRPAIPSPDLRTRIINWLYDRRH